MSWKADADATPSSRIPRSRRWEQAASLGAREVERVVADVGADAVLAGAGVGQPGGVGGRGPGPGRREQRDADGRARAVGLPADTGRPLHLQPAGLSRDPLPLGCLGGARHGDRWSRDDDGGMPRRGRGGPRRVPEFDQLAGGRFLVGSGGANDVASRATACVVVTLARPERLPETVAYVTSPGQRVVSVVTDKGILRRDDGVLRLAAVPDGEGTVEERVRAFASSCGYEPDVAREVEVLPAVRSDEVRALREYDRRRLFLN